MPETVSQHKVRDINVRIMRRGSGPPLLFLHGANGLPVWLPMFDILSKEFEVIVPEHPGFGGSDDPPWIRSMAIWRCSISTSSRRLGPTAST